MRQVLRFLGRRLAVMPAMRTAAFMAAAFALSVGGANANQAARGQKAKPILQIDSGGHTSLINDIVFTPDGKYLVSASNDKLIRVWDWRAQRTVRIIRGQSGKGAEGTIFAMALSPDGRYLAAGGFMAQPGIGKSGMIRLYDFASGRLLALLKGHSNVVLGLAFSQDSQRLISGSGDKTAIIWDIGTASQITDKARILKPSRRLRGHTNALYAVGFSPDGQRAVSGSYDHDLRLWDVHTGALLKVMRGHRDKVRALAISSGGLIASGSFDHNIKLWDGKTGAFLRTLADQSTRVGSLSFSADGKLLLSSCGHSCKGNFHQYVFDVATGQERLTYRGHDNVVLATAISPDGRFAATGGGDNQEIHIWNVQTGKVAARLKGGGKSVWAAGFGAKGQTLGWGYTDAGSQNSQKEPYEYQLRLPNQKQGLGSLQRLSASPTKTETADPKGQKQGQKKRQKKKAQLPVFLRAVTRSGHWHLKHRKGGRNGYISPDGILGIFKRNKEIAFIERGITDGQGHTAYSFTPDGNTIITGGGNGVLESYDKTGQRLHKENEGFVGHTGDIWAVTISPDGRLLVSSSADQTVRLWNVKTRELIVTLFHTPKTNQWALWTPQGYYMASQNGRNLVGWQLNRGADKAADHLSGAQLHKYLYSPEIVQKAIRLRSAKAAIKSYGGKQDILQKVLASGMPPRLTIKASRSHPAQRGGMKLKAAAQTVKDGETVTQGSLSVAVLVSAKSGGIGKAEWRVNGITLGATERSLSAEDKRALFGILPNGGSIDSLAYKAAQRAKAQKAKQAKQEKILTRSFELAEGKNTIELVVYNAAGKIASKPVSTTLTYQPTAKAAKPDLYVVSVGVNDYWQGNLHLNYALNDATALAKTLKDGGKDIYQNVHVTTLLDKQVTAKRLDETFAALSKQVKANDVFIFFIAGHGVTHKGQYYFLPQDIRLKNMDSLLKQGISQDMWEKWFGRLNAQKSVLLYDTCESGSLVTGTFQMAALEKTIRGGIERVAAIERLSRATGRTVISAASAKAPALEGYRGHGVFAYSLLESLSLADKSRNGLVELNELIDHVELRVPEISYQAFRHRQVPTLSRLGNNYTLSAVVQRDFSAPKANDCRVIPRRTSHISILPTKVFSAPDKGTDVLKTIGPGTALSLVCTKKEGWLLVARNGKRLGYIRKERVVPFQAQ